MEIYGIASFVLMITFVLSFINYRYFKDIPVMTGLMLISMLISLAIVGLDFLGISFLNVHANGMMSRVDFNETLMIGMLGFLLFAGAIHLDINDLAERKLEVGVLAVAGTAISMLIVGILVYLALKIAGMGISFAYCLLFGALISPTDPVSVMGILKEAKAPKSVNVKIAGESLFNDGIGVVFFITFRGVAEGHKTFSFAEAGKLFFGEVAGGAALGFLLGWAVYQILKKIDEYNIEIIGTLALVMFTYTLCQLFHISGPIAIVVAGLLIGNRGRQFAMSEKTRGELDRFWELLDYILNAMLFVLIGLEIIAIGFSWKYLLIAPFFIAIVLLARFASVAVNIAMLKKFFGKTFSPGIIKIMTWGGLRGGISIALALSLAAGPEKVIFLKMTYAIVAFSLIFQSIKTKKIAAELYS